MVRLKVYKFIQVINLLINFNSCMVRLKERCESRTNTSCIQFQFLYGAIKSNACSSSALLLAYFNSCMVRLKVIPVLLNFYLQILFQFLYGAIKSIPPLYAIFVISYFNSCMVRLKVAIRKIPSSSLYNFNSCMVRLKVCL